MAAAVPIIAIAGLAAAAAAPAYAAVIMIAATVAATGIGMLTTKTGEAGGGGRSASPGSVEDSGHLVNTSSSRKPLPLCYGETEMGVNRTFTHLANPYLHMICELGEGPINGIVRQDDTLYSTTAAALPTSNPPLVYLDDKLFSEYGSLVHIELFTGTSTQNVCSTLQSATAKWDQALRYTAYLYVRLEYDRDQFKSLPEIKARIQGLKIYNPVTTLTAYTNNPALCAYDFVTRSSQRGGIGVAAARILTGDLSDAIDYCTTKAWTCNMPITTNGPVADNLGLIFANYRGDILYSEAKFKFRFADLNHESVVMALDEDDIIQTDAISTLKITQPNAQDRPNAVRLVHLSEEKKYKPDDLIVSDQDAIDAEGDYREREFKAYGLTDPAVAGKMAAYHLERLRLNKTASLTAGSKAMALEALDLITLTHSYAGWDTKKFRVMSAAHQADDTVALSLLEENTTFYDDVYNLTGHNWDTTDLPNPLTGPLSVTGVSHSETVYYHRGRSFTRWEVDFSAPAVTTDPFWSHAEIWLKVGSAGTWRYMSISEGNYQVDPVEEGEDYWLRMRSVSVFGEKEDFDNAYTVSTTIIGKTAVPVSLESLQAIANDNAVNLFSLKVSDPDIEVYEFRLGSSWTGAIFLAALRNPNLSLPGIKPSGIGGHTFYCNTLSNNGFYGATPRSSNVLIKDPPDGWTVQATETCDYNAVGTHSNTAHTTYDSDDYLKGSHTAGVLVGTYTSPIYDRTASARYMIYCLADIVVTGAGTAWDDVIPLVTAGLDLLTDGAMANWTADELDNWTESNCDAAEEVSGETGSAAKITVSAAGGYIYENVTVTAEKWYILRGYYKNTAGDIAQFGVYDVSNSAWLSPLEFHQLADEDSAFTAFEYIFYAPAGCISASIRLGAKTNGDIVWFDTLTLYQVDTTNSTTWADINIDTRSWVEIFELAAGPQVKMKLLYGDASPPTNEVEKMEILSAIVTGRYFQMEIEITDPAAAVNAMVEAFSLKFLQ